MPVFRVRSLVALLVLSWCLLAATSHAFAQVATGTITGVVTDQGHAAVPGATVTVTNIDTNAQRVVSSTNEGVYTAPGLAPGRYRISVDLQGFKPLRHDGVTLDRRNDAHRSGDFRRQRRGNGDRDRER